MPSPGAAEKHVLRSAIVSVDTALRTVVKQVLQGADRGVTLDLEVAVPLTGFGDEQLRTLRNANADLVFLDLETVPVLGT